MGNGAHLLVRQLGSLSDTGAGLRASTCSGEDRGACEVGDLLDHGEEMVGPR